MNIYVGNIPWSVTDDQLEELFAQFGTVTSAKIIVDKFSKRSRGGPDIIAHDAIKRLGYGLFLVPPF